MILAEKCVKNRDSAYIYILTSEARSGILFSYIVHKAIDKSEIYSNDFEEVIYERYQEL